MIFEAARVFPNHPKNIHIYNRISERGNISKMWFHIIALICFSNTVHGGEPSLTWISDAKVPVNHVYLDFDNTITVDGFSEVVRNTFCNTEEYPDCHCKPICNDSMVRYF